MQKSRPKSDEFYKENLNLFACLFQAAIWQSTTFSYDFHFDVKYSINKFKNLAYDMLDKINREIKNNDDAVKYFDEQSSFYLDVMREICTITEEKDQQLIVEIIKSFKEGNIKIHREEEVA